MSKTITFAGDTGINEPISGLPPQITVAEDETTCWLTVTQEASGLWQAGYQEGGRFLGDFISVGETVEEALKRLAKMLEGHIVTSQTKGDE